MATPKRYAAVFAAAGLQHGKFGRCCGHDLKPLINILIYFGPEAGRAARAISAA
jgi:hypothetical protein